MDDRGELQIRACRRVSRAELKIELRAWIDIADLGRWTDANRCFAIAKAEIVESRAPAIRRQPQIRNDARRRDRDDAVEIFEDAADELSGGFVATEGSDSFRTGFFTAGSPEWEAFLSAARRLAQLENSGYPQAADHCLICNQPLTEESANLIQRYWKFLPSGVRQELETERALLSATADTLRRLWLTT